MNELLNKLLKSVLHSRGLIFCTLCFTFCFLGQLAMAQDNDYLIVIKDHKFTPYSLNVPAGQKIKLTIDNQDPTAEEFESYALNREKVVAGGKKIIVFIGPLKPGSYEYIGEFHKDTAKGVIVAQ